MKKAITFLARRALPALAALVTVGAATVVATNLHSTPAEPQPYLEADADLAGDGFWSPVRVVGAEPGDYSKLSDLGEEADVVVRGRITGFRVGLVVPLRSHNPDNDPNVVPDSAVTLAHLEITPEEVLKGESSSEPILLELVVPHQPGQAAEAVRRRARFLPKTDIVVALRRFETQDRGVVHGLVHSKGLWAVRDDGSPYMPLVEYEGVVDEDGRKPMFVSERSRSRRDMSQLAREFASKR